MPQDERGYLIVPHEIATAADYDGCLIVKERGHGSARGPRHSEPGYVGVG
jgi:hypothetical protein